MVQQQPPLVQLFIQKPWQTNTVLYNHVGVISPYGVNRPLIITLRCPSPRPALIFLTEKMTFSSDRQTDESTLAPLCGCHRDDERVWRGRWGMGGWRMGGVTPGNTWTPWGSGVQTAAASTRVHSPPLEFDGLKVLLPVHSETVQSFPSRKEASEGKRLVLFTAR